MEAEDPVVQEIPVYFNEELADSLYLLQYPLRPSYRPVDLAVGARFKAKNSMLEMDIPVDQNEKYYDQDAVEYLKQSVTVLESSRIPAATNYAIGAMRDGELHLTPLKDTFQMRPSFKHFDNATEEEDLDDFIVDDAPALHSNKMKRVEVKLKVKESAKLVQARESSYSHHLSFIEAEDWVPYKVHDKSPSTMESMYTDVANSIQFDMTPEEYTELFTAKNTSEPTLSSTPLHELLLKNPTGPLRTILSLLRTEKLVSLDRIKQKCPNEEEEVLVDLMEPISIRVNGYFVLRGDQYLNSTAAQHRDSILHLLANNPNGVSRPSIVETLSIPDDTVKSILDEFAVLSKASRTWTLLI